MDKGKEKEKKKEGESARGKRVGDSLKSEKLNKGREKKKKKEKGEC